MDLNTIHWEYAIHCHLYDDDSELLASLIREGFTSDEVRDLLADAIVIQPQKPKNVHKRKLNSRQRTEAKCRAWDAKMLADTSDKDFIERLAEENKQEPIEVIREIEKRCKDEMKRIAKHYGVSFETIRKLK